MADEILRSKHGFGSLANVAAALQAGKIDAYDILFLDGDTEPKIGWVDKDSNFRLVKSECVVAVDQLPASGVEGKVYIFDDEGYFWNGTKFVNFCKPTDVTGLEGRIAALETALGKLDTTVVDLQTEVTNVKTDVADVKTSVSNLQTEINGLKTDVSDVKEDVSNLDGKVVDLESSVTNLQTEVEKKANTEDVQSDIEQAKLEVIGSVKDYADEKDAKVLNVAKHTYEQIKYEVTGVPNGVLVDYREDEIRIMCPVDTVFTKQSVGVGGNSNSYYMTFKTYFPNENAVGYIEHLGELVDDEILTKASTDEYGRKYQSTWLALADYDESTGSWKYRGAESTKDGYYGYDYQIDWYNADGVMIASDSVRINLSNEECHFSVEPYYVSKTVSEAKAYTDEQIAAKIAELAQAFTIVEF